jgi:colanic acid/amylovoran biosynthesis glycosyltransferase
MLTVAYLTNRFPSAVEPYIAEEIDELRSRGVRVVAGSVRKPAGKDVYAAGTEAEIVLLPLHLRVLLPALGLCITRFHRISALLLRVLCRGQESPLRRVKALLHTLLGAGYAVVLRDYEVDHIHAHHGYFGSWIAMVAARLLGIDFSLTLHGSDLLRDASYLDAKLAHCSFCLTVSEYNRRFILDHYPAIEARKLIVARLGVAVDERANSLELCPTRNGPLSLLAVGRLHSVKDHAFLVRACAQLQAAGVHFECSIAGDGPERRRLQTFVQRLGLEERVTLLGHVPREQMNSLYGRAGVVVLTSRSEGIPLVLMEAMARGKIVLAPAITGIPELVVPGLTGFLYQPGSMGDFLSRLLFIHSLMQQEIRHSPIPSAANQLDRVRYAARVQVRHNFNRGKNLDSFANFFLQRIAPQTESLPYAHSLLQQVQLSLQRH